MRNGFRFHAVGVGEAWRGFATKFLAYRRALQELVGRAAISADDTVMLQDAWDTVILGSATELLGKLVGLPSGAVLCGAERVCGPNHFLVGQIEALYPEGRTPWRYPNSGGLVASAVAMLALLDGLVLETGSGAVLDAAENDQVRLHDYLLERAARGSPFPLELDVDCAVFQCMYEEQPQWDIVAPRGEAQAQAQGDGGAGPAGGHPASATARAAPRIRNRLTGQWPIVAHGNGHTGRWFLADLYSKMRLLDHLGLTMEEVSHLRHEMPVAPGTEVTEDIKAKYCPWWYTPGLHRGATDGFETFRMIRAMQCGGKA